MCFLGFIVLVVVVVNILLIVSSTINEISFEKINEEMTEARGMLLQYALTKRLCVFLMNKTYLK